MNKLILLVLFLLVAAGVFWYLKPETAQRWLAESPLGSSGELTRVYKWQDPQGRWQLTDGPPPQGIDYEIREYRADLNALPLPPQLEGAAK